MSKTVKSEGTLLSKTTEEIQSLVCGSHLIHQRQRLLHVFLLLFGQILQHLLQMFMVVF